MSISNNRVQHYEKMLHNRNIYDTEGLPAHIAKGLAKQMDSGFKKYGDSGIKDKDQQSLAERYHKITLGKSLQNPIEMEISRNQGAVTGRTYNPPGYNDYIK